MKRSEAREYLWDLARTDPERAWGLGVQYLAAERLSDISVLLGVIAVEMLVALLLVFGRI